MKTLLSIFYILLAVLCIVIALNINDKFISLSCYILAGIFGTLAVFNLTEK